MESTPAIFACSAALSEAQQELLFTYYKFTFILNLHLSFGVIRKKGAGNGA